MTGWWWSREPPCTLRPLSACVGTRSARALREGQVWTSSLPAPPLSTATVVLPVTARGLSVHLGGVSL